MTTVRRLGSALRRLGSLLPGTHRTASRDATTGRARPAPGRSPGAPATAPSGPRVEYAPRLDGEPDPGEVVWAWVPYEDDPSRGKDRPVLVIGRDGATLLALTMTSKDHDRDAADEARWGRVWMDVGTGPWDAQRRPSEVRLDRVIRLPRSAVRREGAILDRAVFDAVTRAVADVRRSR
ncbi:type II toxin-antitoxin system PemK/MazF family toxin [Cellulomonas fimi]|uniref:type II toxin-antitoxin system PemK/MazF family toxin n=1 Tax=Cellulomonas fimi TaxID=1708 RepID=UPI00234D3F9E|nr:type II toxin-antitoxin system PemK/MazF family toxin [Cellulomonas fimi]MDC7121040.1 type II toxin-antitoxin system PemK/MazF family toxin [Cellulomonas fimi]